MKISTKIPLFFVLMLAVVILFVSFVGYSITARALERSSLIGLHTSAKIAAKRFQSFLEDMENQAKRANQDSTILSAVHGLKSALLKKRVEAKKRLDHYFKGIHQITRLHFFVYSVKGRLLYSLHDIYEQERLNAFRHRALGAWQGHVLFSRPFFRVENHQKKQYMFGATWMFSKSRKSEALLLFLFEAPTHLLSGTHFGRTGRVQFGGWITKHKPSALFGKAQGIFRDCKGRMNIGVWHSIGWRGLWVEARISLQEAMEPIVWLRWMIGGGACLLLLSGFFLVMSFSKVITEPIEQLSSVARHIAEGDLELRARIQTKDEIGELARHFNRMADRVVARQKRFEDLLENASDAILSVDSSQKIVLFNRHAEAVFGYAQEEILGKSLALLLPHKVRAEHHLYVKDFTLEKQHRRSMGERQELQGIRRDGSSFPADISISKMLWEGEWVYTAIVRDVTEKKEAARKLQEAHELLERRVIERTADLRSANKELRSFTYIVSHDLRAPLVNLKGFSGELQHSIGELQEVVERNHSSFSPDEQETLKRLFSEDLPECLDFINSSTSRMDALINAILALSRVGYRKLTFSSISLNSILEEVVKSMGHQIDKRKATIHWKELPTVCGDRISLTQIMANLIGNAIKYHRPNTPVVIEVFAEVREYETQVSVKDNGRGLLEEDIPKVFELFRRVGVQKEAGEGMGLNFVRTLVRRHGGRIWCDSTIGEGSTFHFTLRNAPPKEEMEEGNLL